jgi:hypothetical protein
MIDDPGAAESLLARLKAALPIPARLAPELQASLREQAPARLSRPPAR